MTRDKTLMVLQAGQSQVRIMRTAQKMGLRVVATDRNKNAPGFLVADAGERVDVIDKEGTLKMAEKYGIDGILPGGDVSLPTAAYVAEEMGLVGLTPEQAEIATNKELYYTVFEKTWIPYPRTQFITDLEECYKAIGELGFPVITKPTTSFGGSRGVKRINNWDDIEDSFVFAKNASKNGRVMVEKFIDGEEHTVESIIHDGKNYVLGISDKERIKESYCLATSLNYPSQLPEDTLGKIKELAGKIAEALQLQNWITHTEVITYEGEIKVVDFGARGGGAGYIPAVIIPQLCGIEMMEEFIRILLGEEPHHVQGEFERGVVYRFFTPPPGRVTDIEGVEEVEAMKDVVDFHLYVKEGDIIPPLTTQLERSGYFVVKGNSFDDVIKKARHIENKVKIITNAIEGDSNGF
jgi:biotin carboxylase